MSWTDELYKIYENNCGRDDIQPPMLPISHSTANAQIELTVNENGDFVAASKIDKSDAVTIIPVTDDSAARSSGICPHPFADKFVYIAGDYQKYATGKNADNSKYFDAYIQQLKGWAESEYSHKAVKAVYKYLEKAELISDLVKCGVLVTDEETENLKDKEKIAGIAQEECFVRFKVNYDDINHITATWKDKTLYDSFIAYNSSILDNIQLCYATGKELPSTYKHPSKIRNAGDKAKLISANDESGFSYRGRFNNKEQAISVSYDFSQKMHNGLKWLIQRQGVSIENSLMLVVWESALQELPKITEDFDSGFEGFFEDDEKENVPDTYPMYRDRLKKSIFGIKQRLEPDSKAMVMGLDSATTGRLSIVVYSELQGSEFLDNIQKWHDDTAWNRFNGKLKKTVVNSFSLRELINCAFGTEQGSFIKAKDKVVADYMCRLIPCVTEQRKIPKDLLSALVNKASNPLAYDNSFNWQKVLEAACAIIRKTEIEKGVECGMVFDKNCKNRSYLFGGLLAIADKAENDAYDDADRGKRITNAKRYWNRFSSRPYQTWQVIEERLRPYLDKLGGSYYQKMLNELMSEFSIEDFSSDQKLEPCYLLGYHCMMRDLYTSNKSDKSDKNKEE
ncbi:MAG: type I-C CRISPR-associated protein Cas8c/Csd1 [Oscillospiraceae bacterium]